MDTITPMGTADAGRAVAPAVPRRAPGAPPAADVRIARLLQLSSATLPVGAFSYSQGLEYAVECGWVTEFDSFERWLAATAGETLVYLELPVLMRLHDAAVNGDAEAFGHWVDTLVAARETREMRVEESARGRAMLQILDTLEVPVPGALREAASTSQVAGLALAGAAWHLGIAHLAMAHAWGGLENQVTAGIKLIPLGQSDGQRLLYALGGTLPSLVERAHKIGDDEIGAASPALAIAGSLHENQYTRLFRS